MKRKTGIRITPEMLSNILERIQDSQELEAKSNPGIKQRNYTINDIRQILAVGLPIIYRNQAQQQENMKRRAA